jgi:pimeloyl-ACP methyl ester carboxylesterase
LQSLIRGLLIYSVLIITGCSSVVEYQILQANSYEFDADILEQFKGELSLEKRTFCIKINECFPYIYAPKNTQSESLNTTFSMNFTGTEFESSLSLQRNELPEVKGNVLIIHGFMGSKEWMVTTAAYFQFLGLNVYLVDLLGHGENTRDKGFGVLDIPFLSRFVLDEIEADVPLYIVGNSMGSLPTLALAEAEHVKGIILQAPMIRFDQAVPAYVNDRNAWYASFLSNDSLRQGAFAALQARKIRAEQTNIADALLNARKPVLIFASSTDNVSPYRLWKGFENEYVDIVQVEQREHAYMSMIGQSEHVAINSWLKLLMSSSTN